MNNKIRIAPGGLVEFLLCLLIWGLCLINIIPPIMKIIDKIQENQTEINLKGGDSTTIAARFPISIIEEK